MRDRYPCKNRITNRTMTHHPRTGSVLTIHLPTQGDASGQAIGKWLLSLWQSSHKSRWRLWRSTSPFSLELVANSAELTYQVHLRDFGQVELSRRLLGVFLPGVDVQEAEQDRLAVAFKKEGVYATFGLREPGWIDFDLSRHPEPGLGLLQAMRVAEPGVSLVVQLLLHPTWLVSSDQRVPAFWFSGRLLGTGDDSRLVRRQLLLAAAALGEFAGTNGIVAGTVRKLGRREREAAQQRLWTRQLLPPGMPATVQQIASFYHPPAEPSQIPHLVTTRVRRSPAPPTPSGALIGEARDSFGRPVELRLVPRDLLRHGLIVGPSGVGKTTLLAGLASELIASDVGVTVIDPHGSLAREIARATPAALQRSVSLLDFADEEFPISLNPLSADPRHATVVIDELLEILQRVLGRAYWGPVLELMLRHAALATIEVAGSIADSARLLEDASYRERVLDGVHNRETVRFLTQLDHSPSLARSVVPAVHRLQRLTATPLLRNMLTQPYGCLDFHSVMDRGESLLCDLSGVGTGNGKLLGSLVLLLARQAALSRNIQTASNRPHVIIIDEASWFVSGTVGEFFDQARKFGVGMVLAIQRLGQLAPESVRDAVLANAATTIAFRIHDHEEARRLQDHFGSDQITAADLRRLPSFEAYAQLTVGGERHEPAWFKTLEPSTPQGDAGANELALRSNGRRRFARPQAAVEQALTDRERAAQQLDDPEIRTISSEEDEVLTDAA